MCLKDEMKWDVEVNDPCRSRCSVKAEPVEYTETKPQRQKLLYHMTQESVTVSLMLREKLDQKKNKKKVLNKNALQDLI